MTKRYFFLTLILLLAFVLLTACGGKATETLPLSPPTQKPVTEVPSTLPVTTEEPVAPATEETTLLSGDPLRGGLLYDNWVQTLGVETPQGDHPLWATQSTNTRSGLDTWRCKECHGWDYKGAEGAYGSGSHMTGFIGVIQVAGIPPTDILNMLKGSTNPDHDFSAYLDEQALTDLALFLSEYLLDTTTFIQDKKAVGGNPESGKTTFDENCLDCHGPEGLAMNFTDDREPEYLGTLAQDNPWEFIHKARFGQPGIEEMPSLVDLGLLDQDFVDLLSYVQSLPTSSPVAEGGRLYDNWIAAIGAADMSENHPLWATQTTNTRSGNDTWRCKECHGWDYLGVEGRYGSGSHMTGFPGIFAAKDKSAEEILTSLTSGDHDFSAYLNEAQLNALVAFIQQLQDLRVYINDDGSVNGDASHGEVLYNATCAICHGEDGKAIDFDKGDGVEFVGTIAADNPWEAFNKIAYGQPGATMISGVNMDWSWQDILDILAYIMTLPIE